MDKILYDSCPRCGGQGEKGQWVEDETFSPPQKMWDGASCDACDGTGNELYPFLSDEDKAAFDSNRQAHVDAWHERQATAQ